MDKLILAELQHIKEKLDLIIKKLTNNNYISIEEELNKLNKGK